MAFRDILVHLDAQRSAAKRLRLAVSIARPSQAHLTGIYGFELPRAPFPGLAAPPYVVNATARTVYERERDGAFADAAQIEADFHAEAKRAGLSGDWRIGPDKPADLLNFVTARARYADVTVLGQADPDHPYFDTLARLPETVMLGSGRPVLIVPYAGRFDTVGRNVLVAWSGTREGARAVADALPLMQAAEAVTVVSIGPTRGEGEDDPATGLAQHLARHDIRADASHLMSEDIEPGELILSRASDLGCDLIVMGGYGHSRTRELILGGVTRAILQHMTVPVLMSH
jgi:nucleotide-binding universal stress UspA family protein